MFRLGVAELAVILIFGIPLAAIIGGIFLSALKIIKGDGGKGARMSPDDTRIVQDVFRGLKEMEKRVEALETILMDKCRGDEK